MSVEYTMRLALAEFELGRYNFYHFPSERACNTALPKQQSVRNGQIGHLGFLLVHTSAHRSSIAKLKLLLFPGGMSLAARSISRLSRAGFADGAKGSSNTR